MNIFNIISNFKMTLIALSLLVVIMAGYFIFHTYSTKQEQYMKNTGTPSAQEVTNDSIFEWLAKGSQPPGAPMKIIAGGFPLSDGYYYGFSLGSGPWGTSNSIAIVGDEKKPLPDKLEITFYSYLEDKFYYGSFQLPYDHIKDLFNNGHKSFMDPADQEKAKKAGFEVGNYREIITGVAPGGFVTVWVGGGERREEVFSGYAKEIELDWNQAFGFPEGSEYKEEAISSHIAQMAKQDFSVLNNIEKIPLRVWKDYNEEFTWYPVFEGTENPPYLKGVEFFNGEKDNFEFPLDDDDKNIKRPIPKSIYIENDEFWDYIYFDWDKAYSTFKRLSEGDKSVELIITKSTYNKRTYAEASLRNNLEKVELGKGENWIMADIVNDFIILKAQEEGNVKVADSLLRAATIEYPTSEFVHLVQMITANQLAFLIETSPSDATKVAKNYLQIVTYPRSGYWNDGDSIYITTLLSSLIAVGARTDDRDILVSTLRLIEFMESDVIDSNLALYTSGGYAILEQKDKMLEWAKRARQLGVPPEAFLDLDYSKDYKPTEFIPYKADPEFLEAIK